MSYLKKAIGANEKLIKKASVHWFIYVWPAIWILLGIITIQFTVGILLLIGLVTLIGAFIYQATTDLAVTDKKIIAKWGLISRNTIEQRLTKIDTIQVNQGIFGRIFGFGSILVTGSGVSATPIKNIANPLEFRRNVEQAVEVLEGSGN